MRHLSELAKITAIAGILACAGYARVFFTGSNPMLSSIALPQDLLLIPGGDKISSYTAWQTFPWWGDIDEPENRPGKKYTLTGDRSADYEYRSSINEFAERIGISHWRNDHFRTNYELTYATQHLRAEATGVTSGENGLPYSYLERHAIREGAIKAMLATYFKSHPIGMSLSLGGIQTSRPKSELLLGADEQTSSNLLLWGWDGESEREQDNLSLGWLLKGDAQLGITFGEHDKIGSHFKLYTGRLREYNLNASGTDYDITPKDIHNYTVRLYGIKNWYKQDNFRFNTTVLTRYTFVDSVGRQSWENSLVDYRENFRTFVFQVNPNVNIYPWKYPMSFIDAAILCNYQHQRYDFLDDRDHFQYSGWWGQVEDIPWEEQFSYGRENFFELALDIFASIPVFGMKDQSAGVVISALLWRRYKWMNKYFGQTDWQTGDFTTTNIRKNFEKETWLNAVVNLVYRRGGTMFRLDIAQPLIYSLTPRTTVYDADGTVEAGKTMEKMWLSQAGFKVGFFVSTDLTNFIRYQPFARPPVSR